jgi:hypothetical protein
MRKTILMTTKTKTTMKMTLFRAPVDVGVGPRSQKQRRRSGEISSSEIDKVTCILRASLVIDHCCSAALKCRQRKKAWLNQLQANVEFLKNENERLVAALAASRDEVARLSTLVGGAAVGSGLVNGGVSGMAVAGAQPVSMNMALGKSSNAAPVGQSQASSGTAAGRTAYGY